METEENIIAEIQNADKELQQARNKVSTYKKNLVDAESDLIAAKLMKERLVEKLRVWRNKYIDDMETTDREEDIERFKLVLHELMKKIK